MPERFRTAAQGYDPEEVDRSIAARDDRIERLQREVERLSRTLADQERRLRVALSGHAASGPFGLFGFGPIEAVLRILARIHARARRRAVEIQRRALRDSVGVADRILELTRLREELGFSFTSLAERLGLQLDGEDAPPAWGGPADREAYGAREGEEIRIRRVADEGVTTQDRGGAKAGDAGPRGSDQLTAPAAGGGVYSGTVAVEVGPLRDFAQLTGIEDAIGSIEGVGDVQVESFSGGRAKLAVTLWEECDLIGQLKLRIPLRLKVRSQAESAIVLDAERAA